jgi:hypothetical protein
VDGYVGGAVVSDPEAAEGEVEGSRVRVVRRWPRYISVAGLVGSDAIGLELNL